MKVAVWLGGDTREGEARVGRMVQAQRIRDHHLPAVLGVEGGALGWVEGPERISRVRLRRRGPAGQALLVSGVPISPGGDLDSTLDLVTRSDYRVAGQLLASLEGAFAALFWDAAARRLVVVTDFLGMQPLYEVAGAGPLVLATEVKGVAASGAVVVKPDPSGWGALLALGHLAEDLTSLDGVRRVPAATVRTYGSDGNLLEGREYWRWPDPRPGTALDDVPTEDLLSLFSRQVAAYGAHGGPGILPLSGGFDSRLILCTLRRLGLRPRALVLSNPNERDDADGRFGRALARRFDLPYRVVTAPSNFYSEPAYLDYLIANEVTTPSFGLFIAQLAGYLRTWPDGSPLDFIWEGVAPAHALKAPHQTAGGFDAFLAHKCHPQGSRWWAAAGVIFAPGLLTAMRDGLDDLLKRIRTRYADDGFGVAEFIARSRMRMRTGPNPLVVYANDVLPFTPGLLRAFWDITASLPFEVKKDKRLYLKLFRQHLPEAVFVPFSSGGDLFPGRGGLDWRYHATRALAPVTRAPVVGGLLRRAGFRPRLVRETSSILDRAVAGADPQHPDLNADGVRAIQAGAVGPPTVLRTAREWLFYWQMWRWIMDGSIHARRDDLLGGGGD